MYARLNYIIDYVLLILIVITTNSMYVSIIGSKLYTFVSIIILISLMLKISTLTIARRNISKIASVIFIYYVVIVILFLIHEDDIINMNILNYFINSSIIIVIVIINSGNMILTMRKFINIVLILSIISLFFWVLGSNFGIIKPTNYVVNDWNGGSIIPSYYNIYFESQSISIFGNELVRNSGVYPEVPMWNLLLCVAVVFQEYFIKKTNWKTILLVVTILSTTSTTGVFVLGLIIIYKLSIKYNGLIKYIGLCIVPMVMYLLLIVWDNKSESGSANIRFDDYRAGFLAWKDNIFFGSGFMSGLKNIEQYMDTTIRINYGYSNALFVILAQGGLLLLVLYFYPMIRILLSRRYDRDLRMSIVLIMLLISTTIFSGTYLFSFLVAVYYSYILKGDSYEKNK